MVGMLLLFTGQSLFAQKSKKKDEKKTDKYAELIKDTMHKPGFVDTYQTDEKLYFAIKPEMIGKDFLMNFEIAQGIGASGLYGGTMLNIFEGLLVRFEKHEGKIFLVQRPHRYVAEDGTPEKNAVELTFGSSVLETAKVEATNKDSVMLINTYDWFVSDLSQISQRVQYAVSSTPGRPGRANLDKGRSYLKEVKSFPNNTNLTAMLTFQNAEQSAPRSVPDQRYIPVGIHYTLAALPEQPMEKRLADDRIGFFMTVHKDFSDDNNSTFFNRYVNRWRLECKNEVPEGQLCEPKNPIIYYVDRTVPKEYSEAMIAGVDAWAVAFEKAGFKNAIRGEMLPDDADPEDIRYATLRWNTSDQPGYGAIGPSVVDPRTGEILDADILFEANMVQGFKNSWRNMVNPTTALETMLGVGATENQGLELADFAATFSNQGMLMRSVLVARGDIGPNESVPKEFVDEAIKWVTMHEVGHSLGLQHNFKSSVDTPLDKLYDKQWTARYGVFSSVMDYPSLNLPPMGQEPGHFYNTGVGSYDRWAISFGYFSDADKAKEIARQAAKPGHALGTDIDARGSSAIDPTVNVYDLSSDPMKWGKQRADLIREMIPTLPDIVLADNEPYYQVTDLFQMALGQYARAVGTAVKYVGGQYQYRDHVGDPNGRAPFKMVSKAKQQQALDFIVEYMLADQTQFISPDLYQKFGADRWAHWGNSSTYSGRIDYPLHQTLLEIQTSFMDQLISPYRLAKIRDGEVKFGADNVLGIPELMSELQIAVWNEAMTAPGQNIASNRRDLQRAHLDRMIGLLTEAPEIMPADARSVVRMQLQDLKSQLDRRLAPPTFEFDDYTRAHLEESQTRIERALAAGFRLEN
jgi:hypothetical protein